MAELNLDRYHFKTSRMGLTFIGTWFIDHARNRPCLVIIREGEELKTQTPCIISIDEAWIFDPDIGDPRRAARWMFDAIRVLRLAEHDAKTALRLGDLVANYTRELIRIPPYIAPDDRPVIAEGTMTDSATGKVREIAIKDG
jgi:hypothetical protein